MAETTREDAEAQFDKADEILAEALQQLMAEGVPQEVFGMALFELGVLALVRLGETDAKLAELMTSYAARARETG